MSETKKPLFTLSKDERYYCTDCENLIRASMIHDGRCGCGSGRILGPLPTVSPLPVKPERTQE
jgi:hypothetical protein